MPGLAGGRMVTDDAGEDGRHQHVARHHHAPGHDHGRHRPREEHADEAREHHARRHPENKCQGNRRCPLRKPLTSVERLFLDLFIDKMKLFLLVLTHIPDPFCYYRLFAQNTF